MCNNIDSFASAQRHFTTTVQDEEQGEAMIRRLVEDGGNEILEENCNANSSSSFPAASGPHLRHHLPQTSDIDDDQELSLLSKKNTNVMLTKSGHKTHLFAKFLEKFLSAFRMNVNILTGRRSRRATKWKFKKVARPVQNAQTEFTEERTLPGLRRVRRWDIRKILSDIIKIEEEIVASVPRSILYYV